MKYPLVDKSTYVSASIRLLHPSRITVENLIKGDSASEDMIRFLLCCMRYGVSFVVAGATFSGKTTLLNALLKKQPDDKRIFTIEAGSRELDLVRKDEETEKIINNVVHTLAKKSDKPAQNITMEKLVVASLRFNPDLIVVGEMRDEEAYAAIDASLTGHTLVSTIHSFAGEEAHMRLATLCQKRFPMDLGISLMQAAKAFPVVCFEQKLDDGSRKITNITECEVDAMGHRNYHTLFRYVVDDNEVVDGRLVVHGHYEAVEKMSNHLRERMMMFGIPSSMLAQLDKR
jgi:pilus assembly protein CpaF